jgi:cytochrome P450
MLAQEARTVSLGDNLRFNLLYVLPYFTQGIFTRNRFWVGFWTRVHRDPLGVRLIASLRRKYGTGYLNVRVLTTRSLLVLDVDGIRRVLDGSPWTFADPPTKHKGMAHFQPNAVTISRGDEWYDRRRFNEAVLGGGEQLHPFAGHILALVQREVDTTRSSAQGKLAWPDIQDLFERITLQVIFGTPARDDRALMRLLQHLMRESNRVVALHKSRYFDAFYARMRPYLEAPPEHSLVALFAGAHPTAVTKPENQVPHWMFAMDETLATNAARALALIVAHPQAEARVRDELSRADLSAAPGVQSLIYLEGCLLEAMRLWPTTPMLLRQAVAEAQVDGARVPAGTQVIVHNGFNHRDAETYPLADTFAPEQWPAAWEDYRFNYLSHGPQICAGIGLALFIGKAVLAALLSRDRYVLQKPGLDPSLPLPHAFDYFSLAFSREPLT